MRAVVLTGLPLICAACANEPGPKVMGFQSTANPLAIASASAAPTGALPAQPMALQPHKTMADKVLAAIALERVTGRKPDPSRLTAAD